MSIFSPNATVTHNAHLLPAGGYCDLAPNYVGTVVDRCGASSARCAAFGRSVMDFLDQLRQQKREGDLEWSSKQAEENRRRDEESARKHAEEEQRRSVESEKDQRKAEAVFGGLPSIVRAASGLGLEVAVLADSFVNEQPQSGSRPITINRRTYHLVGWQIPFHDLCASNGIPMTVVTERVDVAFKGVRHRTFNVLAVDLKRI
jgi:hypothetical protein